MMEGDIVDDVGGPGGRRCHVAIQREDFDSSVLVEKLVDGRTGCVVTFTGTVREWTGDRKTLDIYYECYEEMAEKEIAGICEEALEHFGVLGCSVVHRANVLLRPGDRVVFIGVSAAHRKEAFRACEYIIDEVKKRAPIWKKERYDEAYDKDARGMQEKKEALRNEQ